MSDKYVIVEVDQNKCVGCGMCASMNPEVFEMVNGKSNVKKKKVKLSEVKEIAENCPMKAIIIKEVEEN